MSNLINKAKEAVDKVVHPEHHKTAPGSGSTNNGPHDSNLANKADPRVDSDRDGSRNAGAATGSGAYDDQTFATGTAGPGLTGVGTTGHTTHGTAGHNTHGTTGTSTNAGPHSSNLANKADPRIDSDLDGSRNAGASSGYGAGHSVAGGHGSTTAGPHDSNLANKLDPRVDSDLDGSRTVGGAGNTGYGSGSTGLSGTGTGNNAGTGYGTGSTGNTGHTGTSGNAGLGGSGPGPAPNTAGPHKSDLLNKADPRVDADLDGSKTFGGNKTYQ